MAAKKKTTKKAAKKKAAKKKAAKKARSSRKDGLVTVRLAKVFRGYAHGEREYMAAAGSLEDVLDELGRKIPALRETVLTGQFGKDYYLLVDAQPVSSLHIEVEDGQQVGLTEVLPGPGAERRRVYLTFSTERVPEALVWQAGQLFDVTTNLRTASISEQIGLIATEFEGEPDEIEGALEFLRRRGVTVEPIEMSIVEG